jgi:hypothetical protein
VGGKKYPTTGPADNMTDMKQKDLTVQCLRKQKGQSDNQSGDQDKTDSFYCFLQCKRIFKEKSKTKIFNPVLRIRIRDPGLGAF